MTIEKQNANTISHDVMIQRATKRYNANYDKYCIEIANELHCDIDDDIVRNVANRYFYIMKHHKTQNEKIRAFARIILTFMIETIDDVDENDIDDKNVVDVTQNVDVDVDDKIKSMKQKQTSKSK